jgi:hypothetical protein
MKKRASVLFLALSAIFLVRPPAVSAQAGVSVSFFYDELSPYGQWSNVGRYGHCWIPRHVAAGWQPYTDGQWVYTDYGWTWVSYDPWGGDPYHYGTWVSEPSYGWVWVPGTVWAPAWVTWSYSDSYVGWAPIPPSLQVSFSGYSGPAVAVSHSAYVFVPVNQFAGVRVSSARLPVARNTSLMQQTRRVTSFGVTNGTIVNRGPSVQRIEASAHTRIPRGSIEAAKTRPAPMTAGGTAASGKRFSVVAPASVRAREFKAHAPAGGASAGGGKEEHTTAASGNTVSRSAHAPATVHGNGAPPKHEAAPKHHEAPPPTHHESEPQSHQTPPSGKHEKAPEHKAVTAAPHHEAPPPVHHQPPPPPHEPPPPVNGESTTSHHESPPPAHHQAPPPAHKEAKPKHEPPPPPGREGSAGTTTGSLRGDLALASPGGMKASSPARG